MSIVSSGTRRNDHEFEFFFKIHPKCGKMYCAHRMTLHRFTTVCNQMVPSRGTSVKNRTTRKSTDEVTQFW